MAETKRKRRRRKASDSYWRGDVINRTDNEERPLTKLKRADESRQKNLNDGQISVTGTEIEIKHPYGVGTIDNWFKKSNILRQCVDCYVTNVTGFGARVVPCDEGVEMDQQEVDTLNSWIKQFNPDNSFAKENRQQIFEYEKYGGRYLEIVRARDKTPTFGRHVPYATIKQQSKQKRRVLVTRQIERGGTRQTVKERKRFRRYIQRVGGTTVYFKEFGDPRNMDWRTGKYETRDNRVPERYQATELLFKKQESEDVYGEPRWIAQVPSVLGSREAEEVNVRYFEDNTIPASIISVSGGRLTRESFLEIKRIVEEGGMSKQNQIMLLEAIAETGGIDDSGGSIELKVDKMTDTRQSDGLFSEYDANNQNKIRSTFRIPPVLLGLSQDVTFATANVSAFIAEMQVFAPERMAHDDWLNNNFVNHELGLNLKTVKLESRGPSISTPNDVVKALTAANVMGAVTPRTSIEMINEQLQVSIPQYPAEGEEGYEEWMDQPLSLSLRLAGQPDERDNDVDRTSAESEISDSESEEREMEEGDNITDLDSRRGMNG